MEPRNLKGDGEDKTLFVLIILKRRPFGSETFLGENESSGGHAERETARRPGRGSEPDESAAAGGGNAVWPGRTVSHGPGSCLSNPREKTLSVESGKRAEGNFLLSPQRTGSGPALDGGERETQCWVRRAPPAGASGRAFCSLSVTALSLAGGGRLTLGSWSMPTGS